MGLIVRFRLLGVEPVFGVTDSQVKPAGLVVAVAVKLSAVDPSVLVSEIACRNGVVAPATAVTLIAPWLTLISGVVLAVSVTGMVTGVLVEPGTLSVIVPVQETGVVIPVVLTETTTWPNCPNAPFVVPVAGVAERKPGQLVVADVTAKFNGVPVLESVRTWLCGDACPI